MGAGAGIGAVREGCSAARRMVASGARLSVVTGGKDVNVDTAGDASAAVLAVAGHEQLAERGEVGEALRALTGRRRRRGGRCRLL